MNENIVSPVVKDVMYFQTYLTKENILFQGELITIESIYLIKLLVRFSYSSVKTVIELTMRQCAN